MLNRRVLIFTVSYSSTIVQDLVAYCQSNPSFAIAYFYFDFHDSMKQRYENLVRSLVDQLYTQCTNTPEVLENLYSRNRDGAWQPTTEALVAALRDIVYRFQHTYIVLDALDECSERGELLSLIEEIIDWKIETLHLLATSRKEQDIDDCLSSRVSNEIDIQSTLVDADIRVHVRDQLRKDRKLKKWSPDAQAEIETALVDGAHGM